jgi:hypothetical protein
MCHGITCSRNYALEQHCSNDRSQRVDIRWLPVEGEGTHAQLHSTVFYYYTRFILSLFQIGENMKKIVVSLLLAVALIDIGTCLGTN